MTLKQFIRKFDVCDEAAGEFLEAQTTDERLQILLECSDFLWWLFEHAASDYIGEHKIGVPMEECGACQRIKELDTFLLPEERLLFALMWLDWVGLEA